jgi:hypothetical protein
VKPFVEPDIRFGVEHDNEEQESLTNHSAVFCRSREFRHSRTAKFTIGEGSPDHWVSLTVEYRDADGAFHGVIFRTPSGKADAIQKELIAQGAHTTLTSEQAETVKPSTGSSLKEQTQ